MIGIATVAVLYSSMHIIRIATTHREWRSWVMCLIFTVVIATLTTTVVANSKY